MEITSTIIFAGEIAGIVAFSLAGAMVAVERGLDYFGIVFLAVLTATGGGVIRDLLLGNIPPSIFLRPAYVIVAVASSVLLIVILALRGVNSRENLFATLKWPIAFFDALGLGIFTVVAINMALAAGHTDNVFFCVFIGMTTGIGGGILRDIIVRRTPVVLRQDIYALLSIGGGILYYYLRFVIPLTASMFIVITLVTAARMIVVKYKLRLPNLFENSGE